MKACQDHFFQPPALLSSSSGAAARRTEYALGYPHEGTMLIALDEGP